MDFIAKNVMDRAGNEFLQVQIKGSDGIETVRTLTVHQFCQALGESLIDDVVIHKMRKDFFPKTAVESYFGDYQNYTCIWEVEPKKRVFVFSNGRHYHIPYPRLVFKLVVRKGRVLKKECFALKGKRQKKLCRYPFGNVSSSGSICTGNIDLSRIETVEDFSDEFFLGVTNNDYFNSCSKVSVGYTQEQLLDKLEKLDEFPEKWLVEDGKSMKDILSAD